MRQVLYTEKTVAQCMSALTERLQSRGKHMDGWVEKNGSFAISLSSALVGNIIRRTQLRGKVERQAGVTVVHLDVPSGADRRGQIMIFLAVALMALLLVIGGQLPLAILIVIAGVVLYIPLAGDHKNSPALVSEIQRTLKASTRPPKKTDAAPKPATIARPAAPKTAKANTAAPKTSATIRKTGDTR